MTNKTYAYDVTRGLLLWLAATLVFTCSPQPAACQKRGRPVSAPRRGPKAAALLVKRFEVEAPLRLTLTGCRGDIRFPGIGLVGVELQMSGNTVTLRSEGGEAVMGGVIAYARSAYRIDANVALTFNRSGGPVTSPGWAPPTILSLRLTQDRKNPKRITLTPAPGEGSGFTETGLSCTEAGAAPK